MKNLTETLHHIPDSRREYVAFSGANATTPYLADHQQKYQRKLLPVWTMFWPAAICMTV